MPTPSNNPTRGSVADFLRAKIQTGSRLSVVSDIRTIKPHLTGSVRRGPMGDVDGLTLVEGDRRTAVGSNRDIA